VIATPGLRYTSALSFAGAVVTVATRVGKSRDQFDQILARHGRRLRQLLDPGRIRQASLSVAALTKAAKTPATQALVAHAHADWSISALRVFLGAYVLFATMT
jgi:hypothetical protein